MPNHEPSVLESALDWLNEWANNPDNGANIASMQARLAKYQNRPIRKNASASWQDSTSGAVIPAPPSECIWEWDGKKWGQITFCPSGKTCSPPADTSPMPPGVQIATPCVP